MENEHQWTMEISFMCIEPFQNAVVIIVQLYEHSFLFKIDTLFMNGFHINRLL